MLSYHGGTFEYLPIVCVKTQGFDLLQIEFQGSGLAQTRSFRAQPITNFQHFLKCCNIALKILKIKGRHLT